VVVRDLWQLKIDMRLRGKTRVAALTSLDRSSLWTAMLRRYLVFHRLLASTFVPHNRVNRYQTNRREPNSLKPPSGTFVKVDEQMVLATQIPSFSHASFHHACPNFARFHRLAL
jgi:hypothetical protein